MITLETLGSPLGRYRAHKAGGSGPGSLRFKKG